MDRFGDVEAFLAIVERGNLSAAARHLGRSLQAVSRSLAALEKSVGVELVRRTTHKAQPTDAGYDFYRRVKPALLEIAEAKAEAGNRRAEPAGLLKIGGPELLGPRYLIPIVARFMETHPKVEVEFSLSNRFVDLVQEGLDLAIRIGELPDSDLKARRVGAMRRVVFGAPSYFVRHGRPHHPRELTEHQCIFRNTDRDAGAWQFQDGGKPLTVKVGGRLHLDNAAASHAAVAVGLGIGRVPLWQIQDLVDSGRVEVILEAFEQPAIPVHIIWPAARLPLAKTRLFIDFLAANLHMEQRNRDCIAI
ncbi:LysR family transcriptional regulator [Mesorhizobium retamae]|uniref:LysR family transcriptional regulator n=1 Tax=Mesorhizobium retamae TaxID=2912854 RepID=A0ABS9QGZ3_9HYPH|nr:LysR family transcriptional regulator [Mesorhizobium sp. IRAMC:0171]MCG7506708.1 LysR family transcriptional regulator [Mesorhizobium sp. IRAMC:0171]